MHLFNVPASQDVYNMKEFEAWYQETFGEPKDVDDTMIKGAAQLAWAVSRAKLLKQAFGIDMEQVTKERGPT